MPIELVVGFAGRDGREDALAPAEADELAEALADALADADALAEALAEALGGGDDGGAVGTVDVDCAMTSLTACRSIWAEVRPRPPTVMSS